MISRSIQSLDCDSTLSSSILSFVLAATSEERGMLFLLSLHKVGGAH